MRAEIEGAGELPQGEYEAEFVTVDVTGREPVLRLRLKPVPPPPPKTTFLLVEVRDDQAGTAAGRILGIPGVVGSYPHNEDHPHGCCCQHCPHSGDCRD